MSDDEIEGRALMASVKVIEDPKLARLRARISELEAERDAWISLDKARLKRITELEAESDYAIRALAEIRARIENPTAAMRAAATEYAFRQARLMGDSDDHAEALRWDIWQGYRAMTKVALARR